MDEQYHFGFTQYHSFDGDSSLIRMAYYNDETGHLAVVLKGDDYDRIYSYRDFEPESWTAFTSWSSAGAYYNHYIKNVYDGMNREPLGQWIFTDVSEAETADEALTKTVVETFEVGVDFGGQYIEVPVEAENIDEALAKIRGMKPVITGVWLRG